MITERTSSVPLMCQKGICRFGEYQGSGEGMLTDIKGVNGDGSWLVGISRKTRHGSDSLDHSFWVQPMIATVDLGGQRGSETMSRSSSIITVWLLPFVVLDGVHRLKFSHGRATEASARVVGMCVLRTSTSIKSALLPQVCFTGAVANSPAKDMYQSVGL